VSFKVLKASFLSTIQDYGRYGYTRYGLGQSGALDVHAYSWANYILKNKFNDAVVEISFAGVELRARVDTFIAVTGGDFSFKINGELAPIWQGIKVSNGDSLTWEKPKTGMRTYLAVKGGFDTPEYFGSRSVNLRENIGAKLSDGDELPCGISPHANCFTMPAKYIPDYSRDITVRLLPAYQYSQVNDIQKALFFSEIYSVTADSDRTGCRLGGMPVHLEKPELISEGVSYGSVEISPDGLPIIILKDGPTIGGYPKIGTAFSLDLAQLAQRKGNSKVKFDLMNIEDAQKERAVFNKFFNIL
jgi:biotin-dependent carboxylase-like uncharacterized protein